MRRKKERKLIFLLFLLRFHDMSVSYATAWSVTADSRVDFEGKQERALEWMFQKGRSASMMPDRSAIF